MKKIILSLITLSLFTFSSCNEEFLEYEPSNSSAVGENTITNEQQLTGALLGVYDALQSNNAYGNYYISANEMLSDNGFVMLSNSNRLMDFYRYTHAISNGGSISNMWTIGYRAIARANFVISFDGKVTGSSVAGSIAEARALRALTLFNLVNFYARPYGTINQDLGIPLPKAFETDLQIGRSSVGEVYDEIISELLLAANNIQNTTNTRLNIDAINGLLSRVYLYKKDYAKSIEYADKVLANRSLITKENVVNYYKEPTQNNGETLFAIDFNALDNPGANDAIGATWSIGGRYEDTAATSEFYNLISSTDIRKDLYLFRNDTNDNPKPYMVKKFGSDDQDVVVIRTTEVLLNKIEALYYTNPTSALTELNNWVTAYRDASYSFTGTGQALLDEILKQRRIELAFEGHRYFDMNRYSQRIVRGQNCTENCDIPFDDFRRVFPIPLNEMNTNRLMVQNPQYN